MNKYSDTKAGFRKIERKHGGKRKEEPEKGEQQETDVIKGERRKWGYSAGKAELKTFNHGG